MVSGLTRLRAYLNKLYRGRSRQKFQHDIDEVFKWIDEIVTFSLEGRQLTEKERKQLEEKINYLIEDNKREQEKFKEQVTVIQRLLYDNPEMGTIETVDLENPDNLEVLERKLSGDEKFVLQMARYYLSTYKKYIELQRTAITIGKLYLSEDFGKLMDFVNEMETAISMIQEGMRRMELVLSSLEKIYSEFEDELNVNLRKNISELKDLGVIGKRIPTVEDVVVSDASVTETSDENSLERHEEDEEEIQDSESSEVLEDVE